MPVLMRGPAAVFVWARGTVKLLGLLHLPWPQYLHGLAALVLLGLLYLPWPQYLHGLAVLVLLGLLNLPACLREYRKCVYDQ